MSKIIMLMPKQMIDFVRVRQFDFKELFIVQYLWSWWMLENNIKELISYRTWEISDWPGLYKSNFISNENNLSPWCHVLFEKTGSQTETNLIIFDLRFTMRVKYILCAIFTMKFQQRFQKDQRGQNSPIDIDINIMSTATPLLIRHPFVCETKSKKSYTTCIVVILRILVSREVKYASFKVLQWWVTLWFQVLNLILKE